MKKNICDFYKEVNSNPILKNDIKNKLISYGKNNSSKKLDLKMINETILPTAKKLGFHFSAEDILAYEKEMSAKNIKNEELELGDLENVSGGLNVKTAAISLLAVVGLSSLSTGAMTFADENPVSSPDSYSQTYTDGQVSEELHEQTKTADQIKQDVINKIKEEVKSSNVKEDLQTEISSSKLHCISESDHIRSLIEKCDTECKTIAGKLNSDRDFVSLKTLIEENKVSLSDIFKELGGQFSTEREKVIAKLILDNWTILNSLTHNIPLTASPYFVNVDGSISWPKSNGYKDISSIKNIIDTIKAGSKIDRYGAEYGFYVVSIIESRDVSYEQRSLSSRENKKLYHKYVFTKDLSALSSLIDEFGLSRCVELEEDAVKAYKGIKDKINPGLRIRNEGSNPYAIVDGFNYAQLRSLIKNQVDGQSLVSIEDQESVQSGFEKIREILDMYDKEFKKASDEHSSDSEKILALQKNVQGGYINLTENVKNAKANSGEIAPAFQQPGGGTQIELPCSVFLLKALKFLQDADT